MDWVERCWGIKCVLGDWCRKMMRIWNLLWGRSCSAPPGFGHNMCLVKDRELFRLWVSSSVVFSINKKMVLWGLDGSISLTKVKSWCLGSCFRWGNSPHSTHLPQAQRCQKGLWKSTDGSNYIDNLPFPEAEKSILHWQDSDKFLWKSKRNQYSLCDRNSCEDFLGFHSFPLLFFFFLPPNNVVGNTVKKRNERNIKSQVSLDLESGLLTNLAFFILRCA